MSKCWHSFSWTGLCHLLQQLLLSVILIVQLPCRVEALHSSGWVSFPPLSSCSQSVVSHRLQVKSLGYYAARTHSIRRFSLPLEEMQNDKHNDDHLDHFLQCLEIMPLSPKKRKEIFHNIQELGFESSSELYLLSKDFKDRPEALSSLLRSDFGLNPIQSNLIRGALMRLVEMVEQHDGEREERMGNQNISLSQDRDIINHGGAGEIFVEKDGSMYESKGTSNHNNVQENHDSHVLAQEVILPNDHHDVEDGGIEKPLFKSVVVNQKAKQRHSSGIEQHNYGLPSNYKELYPNLAEELDDFFHYMTTPTASVQESPIRKATALVYIRHAKLFLGWYRDATGMQTGDDSLTIHMIFPNKDSKSAQPIIDFILWLRRTRLISDSYEANMLRGLTKLLKYRFRNESIADPSYGEKSFADIPVVRELRKLHRDANRRQILSPRSSEEDRKWLEWKEYLHVVRLLKNDVEDEIQSYEKNASKRNAIRGNMHTSLQRRIAMKFQCYLVLSFFSCVPDRQRTLRELEIDRSFIRDSKSNCWIIKHGPDDYKTGKTYGDRPPLVLAQELTPAIDDFLQRWRPCLNPTGNHFFVQPRTGKAFTQDTVYSIVARSCYKHTGKKTNPHLLRDMIVTHVRDTDASEKELEALALYMGHSISMQRNSYDRRTVQQKVAPAVNLLRNINRVES